ncbi:MAG: peptidylprolyl isomerase [Planctomycetales bacterium]|nr:peptidylprolyl isomerase [Planctomycetales bacterium]
MKSNATFCDQTRQTAGSLVKKGQPPIGTAFTLRGVAASIAGLGLVLCLACIATAQESTPEPEKAAPASKEADAYHQALDQWKSALKDLQATQVKYQDARSDAEASEVAKVWDSQMIAAEQRLGELRTAAVAAFLVAPNQDKDLTQLLLGMLQRDYETDNFEAAYPIAMAFAAEKGMANAQLLSMAGTVCFCVNEFDKAEELYKRVAEAGGTLDPTAQNFAGLIPEYKQLWKEEQEARKRDAESNLPRVSIKTNRGTIEVELFENEAPDTVANFIYLVERKFYDGLTFHRVLEHFMAQGGCPDGTGGGGPGYEIYCECYKEAHRSHFRGELSMAHAGRDTGGSQFFLTFVPTAHLNGQHTVFGRVVNGMEVLAKLRRREPDAKTPPDRMLEVRVIRKDENKKYVPHRVQ